MFSLDCRMLLRIEFWENNNFNILKLFSADSKLCNQIDQNKLIAM